MGASGSKRVGGDKDKDELDRYLNRRVEAVALPEKWGQETYPPLILDAASGAGKTQQAFALVQKHGSIIYFIMSKPSKGDQQIYQSMRARTNDTKKSRFAHRVEVAIEALGEENSEDEDICSVESLWDTITEAKSRSIRYDPESTRWTRTADSDVKGLDQLMDVVLWMGSKHLQYDDDSGLRVVPIKLEGKMISRFEDLCLKLEDSILFVDEALPVRAGERFDDAINRLRFVRNLGRALTMKVVLAGTAATAANMIAEAPNGAASRSADEDSGEMAWIECQLLWKPMSKEEVRKVVSELEQPNDLGKAVISALAKGRPYLVHLFGQVMKEHNKNMASIDAAGLRDVLEEVGEVLAKVKGLSDKIKVVHLMGSWLHQKHISSCAYYVQPADLVRGSYFEPCVVLDVDQEPACGLRMGERSLAPGPLRVKIYRESEQPNEDIMWCAAVEDETSQEQREGYCSDFSGIEYSLSACVQQCLAREPLLAVALSTQCVMNKLKFRDALFTLFKETALQRAANKADGELNEQTMYAVLQLASNCQTLSGDSEQTLSGDRVQLGTFLRRIADYLTNETFAQRVKAFRKYRKSGPSQVGPERISKTRRIELVIDAVANNYTMPWLVPACSLEALEETSRSAPRLFDDINIAGLVPGDQNAPFDAEAYPWENLPWESCLWILIRSMCRSLGGYSSLKFAQIPTH